MSDPAYRVAVQRVVDALVPLFPVGWAECGVRAVFKSPVRTSYEVWYRLELNGPEVQTGFDVSAAQSHHLVESILAIRRELVRVGNPECATLAVRVGRGGGASVDVTY